VKMAASGCKHTCVSLCNRITWVM